MMRIILWLECIKISLTVYEETLNDFKREDIEELFHLKKSRASKIISLMLTNDLIEPIGPTRYKFKK